MDILFKTGKLWQQAVDIMTDEADKLQGDEDLEQEEAIVALRFHDLEEQALAVAAMTRDEWDDFSSNNIY